MVESLRVDAKIATDKLGIVPTAVVVIKPFNHHPRVSGSTSDGNEELVSG